MDMGWGPKGEGFGAPFSVENEVKGVFRIPSRVVAILTTEQLADVICFEESNLHPWTVCQFNGHARGVRHGWASGRMAWRGTAFHSTVTSL